MIPSISLYPSLISSDLLNLERTIKTLDPFCAGYHIDVMDNHFVPNLTWGPSFVNAIALVTTKRIWVHLMVENPASLIGKLMLPAGSLVSFHIENKQDPLGLIDSIREKKWLPSVAISPKIDLKSIEPWMNTISQVLLMSVEPGFSGQAFMPSTFDRLGQLVAMRAATESRFTIGVDGGISMGNLAELIQGGAQEFGIASAIFDSASPEKQLIAMQSVITSL